MNITDLIVEFLKQGNTVELPGIGTLRNERQSAHMDDTTGTFHAEHDAILFSNNTNGNTDFVKRLAEAECVDMKIAQMMWNNYIDALGDKLNRTGSHLFPGIGELHMANGNYRFDGIMAAPVDDVAISNVKRYDNDNTDPFAIFDAPTAEEPKTEPEPQPEPRIEPQPEISDTPKSTTFDNPEPIEDSHKTVLQPESATIATPSAKIAQNELQQDIFSNMKEAEGTSDKPKKRRGGLWLILILLLLLLAAGGYYYYTHYYEPASTSETEVSTNDESVDASDATASTEENNTVDETTEVSSEDATQNHDCGEGFNYTKMVNIFTFNTDLLEFSDAERISNRQLIMNNMREYWLQFLSARHYTQAMPYLQEEIAQYVDRRLAELLDHEGYSAQRFFTTDDFLHRYFYDELKSRKASHMRVTIQSELMNYPVLDDMLRQIVEQYNLTASDVGKAATTSAKPQTAQPKPVVYTAHVETSSKQGFDIIAGFYTSRQTAARQAVRLKDLGCDAYIIDQNQLYYVSMGSAPTRTAAEALYKQITSWYSGSVAIKQW